MSCLHDPARHADRAGMRSPRFCAKDVATCMEAPTAQGPSHTRQNAWNDVVFWPAARHRHLGIRPVSQLNYPARSLPCERFTPALADNPASLGAEAVGSTLLCEGPPPPILCQLALANAGEGQLRVNGRTTRQVPCGTSPSAAKILARSSQTSDPIHQRARLSDDFAKSTP